MPKNSRQKFEYLENKKSFQDEIKTFFIIFEEPALKQIKYILFGRWEPDFNRELMNYLIMT